MWHMTYTTMAPKYCLLVGLLISEHKLMLWELKGGTLGQRLAIKYEFDCCVHL